MSETSLSRDELVEQLGEDADPAVGHLDEARRERILTGLRTDDDELRQLARDAAARLLDDGLAEELLGLLESSSASDAGRSAAATAFGPTMEQHEELLEPFDPEHGGPSPETVQRIDETLARVFEDDGQPDVVRRATLEAAVRKPASWTADAARAAWQRDDPAWRRTAVFCAGYARGLEEIVREALDTDDEDLLAEAVRAAGHAELSDAGNRVLRLARATDVSRPIRMAAVEALPYLRPKGARELLERLADQQRDSRLAEAAESAAYELETWQMIEEEGGF